MGLISFLKNLFTPKSSLGGPHPPEETWTPSPGIYDGWHPVRFSPTSARTSFPALPNEANLKHFEQEMSEKGFMAFIHDCRAFELRIDSNGSEDFEIFVFVAGRMRHNSVQQRDFGFLLFWTDLSSLLARIHPLGRLTKDESLLVDEWNGFKDSFGSIVSRRRFIDKPSDKPSDHPDSKTWPTVARVRYLQEPDGTCYGVGYYSSNPEMMESERCEAFLRSLEPLAAFKEMGS